MVIRVEHFTKLAIIVAQVRSSGAILLQNCLTWEAYTSTPGLPEVQQNTVLGIIEHGWHHDPLADESYSL